MSPRTRLLLLALSAALVLSTVLFLLDSSGGSQEAPGPAPAQGFAMEQMGAAPDAPTLVLLGDEQNEAPKERRSAQASILEESKVVASKDAVLAYGIVDFPAEAGWEDSLTVYALKKQWSYSKFAGIQEAYMVGLQRERLGDDFGDAEAENWKQIKRAWKRNVLGQAPVQADGAFALPMPAGSHRSYLQLRGRKLFSSQATMIRPGGDSPATHVPARAGAFIVGQLHAGEGQGTDGELLGSRITVKGSLDSVDPMLPNNGMGSSVDWAILSDEQGIFELRAVPGGVTPTVNVVPENYAPTSKKLGQVFPGEERSTFIKLERGGKVSGRVVDGDGAPLAGAEVASMQAGSFFGVDDTKGRKTKTDDQGLFELEHLATGSGKLLANHPDFLESRKQAVDVPLEGELENVLIELTDGSKLSGSVRWDDGSLAQGVKVRVQADMSQLVGMAALAALRGSSARTTTDAAGLFEVSGLGIGPFKVSAEAPERGSKEGDDDAPIYRGSVQNIKEGSSDLRLTLTPPNGLRGVVLNAEGQPLTEFELHAVHIIEGSMGPTAVDVRDEPFNHEEGRFILEKLAAGEWRIEGRAAGYLTSEPLVAQVQGEGLQDGIQVIMTPAASVAGSVVDVDGEAVEGALIFAKKAGDNVLSVLTRGQAPPSTTTDAMGVFTLDGLPPQAMELYANKDGYATSTPLAVELTEGQLLEEQLIVLLEGGKLMGELFNKEGELDPGVTITVREVSTQATRLTTTDSAGRFEILHLVPGSYQVIALGAPADSDDEDGGLDMASIIGSLRMEQATIVEGEETFVTLGAPPANPVHVHGKVTLAGEPQAGSMVSFYAQSGELFSNMKLTTTNKSGEYEVTLDGAGGYVANVAQVSGQPGQQNSIEYMLEVPEQTEELRHDFELPLGRISGKVFGGDGQPAKGARVTLTIDGGARSDSLFGGHYTELSTDAEGRYDVVGLRPGRYRLSAGGAGLLGMGGGGNYGRETKTGIELSAEQWLQDIDFRLSLPGTLEVRVLEAGGQPVANATIYVRDSNGRVLEPFSMQLTDGTGTCICAGLAPGEVTATARVNGMASEESSPIKIVAEATAKLDLHVESGTILIIRLRDGDGADIRAQVRVVDRDGRELGGMLGVQDIMKLYSEGGFSPTEQRIGPLLPGKYKVYATAEGGLSCKKNVIVKTGVAERSLTLRLKK